MKEEIKEEAIKQAFSKIKQDILSLGKEISEIREQLLESNHLMKQINDEIIQLKLEKIAENQEKTEKISLTDEVKTPTHITKTPTHPVTPTHIPTHPQEIQGLKYPNFGISIGNQGVPTDRQTNQQTDQHIFRQIISRKLPILATTKLPEIPKIQEIVVPKEQITQIEQLEQKEKPISQQISEVSDILDSLDSIRKEIRRKFKNITKQEMLVFSTIYQLEEQGFEADYSKLSSKLSLSQSSVRDYVQKMIKKGIPITKEKLNNKKIILHISPELKKIATLDTIIKLREINSFR